MRGLENNTFMDAVAKEQPSNDMDKNVVAFPMYRIQFATIPGREMSNQKISIVSRLQIIPGLSTTAKPLFVSA